MLQYKITVKYQGAIIDRYSLYGERQDVISALKKKYNCNLSLYYQYVEVTVLDMK